LITSILTTYYWRHKNWKHFISTLTFTVVKARLPVRT